MYQKCPVCEGLGKVFSDSSSVYEVCSVCMGKKIVNSETGLPPNIQTTSIKSDDSRIEKIDTFDIEK